MSAAAASALVALFHGGIALGGLLGGWVGDATAARWPNHGRIAATQFSVATGIPFALLLLKVSIRFGGGRVKGEGLHAACASWALGDAG